MHPPAVIPVLHVGLIGHRKLPSEAIAAIRDAARRVLADIRTAAAQSSRSAPRLRCVCALAEGADLLLAEEALAQDYALLAPLPFLREEYRKDFLDADVAARHDGMLGRAEAVFELDGKRQGSEAYRAVGRLIVEQSDIIVAVWNGQMELGPGGTGEVLHEAWMADVPTIVISTEAPYAIHVHSPVDDSLSDIRSVLDRILSYRVPSRGRDGLALFLSETLDERPAAGGRLARLNPFRRSVRPEADAAAEAISRDEALWPAARAQVDAALQAHFVAADRLAIRYGKLYRVSGQIRYLCAIPATIGALMAFYGPAWMARPGFLIQFAALGGVLAIYALDRWAQWHRRFLDYRYLAEHLRSSRILALFGSTGALPRLPPELAAGGSDWVAFHLRAIVRSLGLIDARMDEAYLAALRSAVLAEIGTQTAFYEARARRYDKFGSTLQWLGLAFYAAGLACTIIRYGMAVAGDQAPPYDLMAELALVLPSIGPIFLGLLSQAEYSRLSQRYGSMAVQLKRVRSALTSNDVRRNRIERMALQMVHVLLAEVSDWRVLIKAHDLSPY